MQRKTLEKFKQEIYAKYGDTYTVLSSEYINNKTPIEFKHTICNNTFYARPDIFLNNYKDGCPFCAKNKRKTHQTFEKEFYDIFSKNEYELLGTYVNADTEIKVLHKVCGNTRLVIPHRLLKGDTCLFCSKSKKREIADIKMELKNKCINFELVDNIYKNNKTPISFKCLKCKKIFKARLNDILSNSKECPHCSKRKISKAEFIIKNILEKNNINFETQYTFNDLFIKKKKKTKLRFDFMIYISDRMILLEFDGEQHFKETRRFSKDDVQEIHKKDIMKNEYCIKNDIELMRITFKDYKNIQNIMANLLSSTTIPDECKVVDSSGSKDSAALWREYNADNIV